MLEMAQVLKLINANMLNFNTFYYTAACWKYHRDDMVMITL